VLSDATREIIYEKVTAKGMSLKAVSAEMHIDVRRVAAVVRLKEVEKQWLSEVSTIPVKLYLPCYMMRPNKIFD
jgi:hypothetical protein